MWAKVDDGWWSHPKVILLPLASRGLWVSALSWSCHQRKAVVPVGFLALVGASETDAEPLVDAGLWDVVDGGWEIHDWADYQELSISEKRAEAGRKGGRASKGKANASKSQVDSEANGQAGPSRPSPSRPTLGKPSTSSATVTRVGHPQVAQGSAAVERIRSAEAGDHRSGLAAARNAAGRMDAGDSGTGESEVVAL